ncbi:nitroreductase [Mycoplasma testudineum]|uniref:Nitroreductase n=1 Tax=Mycoplasma testudineum TaxID=244584 RepID=A0A4V3C2R9_9MOLU|nr:nitroreductase family protein [Mycoplasma testudineum]OYD26606.1 hypothetical protein CG473_03145 [Mycoplasma testudineum]TDO19439.1 nitroreductase [Mycoplasma testudineum]
MSVLDVIKNRHSQRQMQYTELPKEDLNKIVEALNASPTNGNKFDATAIIITNQEVKKRMYNLTNNTGQAQYANCGLLIVCFADMNRGKIAATMTQSEINLHSFDNLLSAWGDAFLMAQSAVLVAEDLGYATAFLSGVRHYNIPLYLREHYKLPNNLFPVLAVAIGKVGTETVSRPQVNRVYFEGYDFYQVKEEVLKFNEVEKEFWKQRGKDKDWISVAAKFYLNDSTTTYLDLLKGIYDPEITNNIDISKCEQELQKLEENKGDK